MEGQDLSRDQQEKLETDITLHKIEEARKALNLAKTSVALAEAALTDANLFIVRNRR